MVTGVVIYTFVLKQPIIMRTHQLFDPNKVINFSWTVHDKNYSFLRHENETTWAPAIINSRIDSKLAIFSNFKLTDMDPSRLQNETVDKVTISLSFSDETTWTGNYLNEKFIWITGPLANKGTQLSTQQIRLFHEGQFAFEPLVWDWCSPKLHKLIYELDEETVEIVRGDSGWEINSLSGEAKIVDPAWIEAWFEKACNAKILNLIDLKSEAFGLENGSLEIFLTDGTEYKYSISSPAFQVSEEKAVISPQLAQLCEELLLAP
ncbi:MAG: hypothetical protein A2Z20_09155 [Bdellovibrionales bacterium RBG_16_40_8]|nr:MAG: hypothetical protein A2Z20_09155 [Bdellovibrionales bacterium RBG_16_40_8]